MNDVAVLIPAYEPDARFLPLLERLTSVGLTTLVLVDDGSSPTKRTLFDQAVKRFGCHLVRHWVNLGKGRALKSGFDYILGNLPGLLGVVTVNVDCEHAMADILACVAALRENPQSLILGCRDFESLDLPRRTRIGNKVNTGVMNLLSNVAVDDIQTDLRAIPLSYVKKLMHVTGEGYDFEVNMLLDTRKEEMDIVQVPIRTPYHRSSHYNPLTNSLKLYIVFLKFALTSLTAFVVDIILFTLFVPLLKDAFPTLYILVATIGARLVSASVNFNLTKKRVFGDKSHHITTALKFFLIAFCQLIASAFLVSVLHHFLYINESVIKVVVDAVLFLLSYQLQRDWVFTHDTGKNGGKDDGGKAA